MAESGITSPTSPALEALQNRSRDVRRARPPDITVIRNEARVPLRPPKRESRIGLRNIFGKSKTVKDEKIMEEASLSRESSWHSSKRSSLVDIGGWPQKLHPSRSDLSLLSSPSSSIKSPGSVASTTSSRLRQNSITVSQGKLRPQGSPKTRDSVTGFIPPPLFQMYPQAIKYATLPTCVTPIEALSRLNELKDNSQQDFSLQGEAERRKKSKYIPEWTNKVYALVTSGYLLQYAGEGRFDRLPEKILHLTRDSAAYASDLIPGKHWVVQVASSMDADGNPALDAKSLRSKLALRGVEKRQVSNMLLVFENPEGMDMWLAILRREIESLGGKKKLSETGKPEFDNGTMLKNQASQRTLVVRDPARFSRIMSQDFSWKQENALADPIEQNEPAAPRLERMSESTVDDGSSMVSSDGQRLDSLRDSGSGSGSSGSSGNRLSFISSGQRTIVSSAESSPTNSPIRASFSSNGEDQLFQLSQKPLPPTPEVRPRPNAAEIANRRQSMQTTIVSNLDPRVDVRGRSIPTLPSSLTSALENKHQFVPNFSVPHTVGRRYSAMNLSAAASRENQPQTSDREGPIRPVRRSPPTKLMTSRPLSIVMDQPSPRSPYSPTGPPNQIRSSIQAPDTPSMFAPRANYATPKQSPQERSEIPESQILKQMTEEANLTSTSIIAPFHEKRSMRASQQYQPQQQPKLPYFDMDKSFIAKPARTQSFNTIEPPEEIRRASSSLEMRRSSMNSNFGHQSFKHALLLSENPPHHSAHHQNRHSFVHPHQSSNLPSIEEPAYTLAPPLICTPKRSAPSLKALQQESLSNNYLAVDFGERALLTRRSLPHLAEGPPPAPPPTCALPPIPTKRSSNLSRGIKA
ncbi:hypothetical protein F4805DRAFT_76633 [Annulohypoxylon moriforme]|nr:hypothetical protein F4805DRAFT_76633 [Annulohypoxylon moriforme]